MVCILKKKTRRPFFLLFEKTKLDQSRGECLYLKIWLPLPCRGFRSKFFFFEKRLDQSWGEGSISKIFSDHYHVEGHDLTNHFVLLFYFLTLWKNNLDQFRGEGLYQKEIDQWPLLCRGPRCDKEINDHCLAKGLDVKRSMTIALQRASMWKRNQWPLPRRGSWCKEIDDHCLAEGLDVT